MLFGVCGGPEIAVLAAEAGFDYFEWTVGDLLRPMEDEDVFRRSLALVQTAPLPCPVVNCFIPGGLKITGPGADPVGLERFAEAAFRRAAFAGVEIIVFGSGGARRVPEGFSMAAAWEQIASFCRMLAPLAADRGVTVAVEPLNRRECNILTTVAESAALVREVDHPAVRLLVDGYHWAVDDGSRGAIVESGPLLRHVHVATVPNRLAPGAEECDLAPFFAALREAGYNGRVSVEGSLRGARDELRRALAVMRELAGEPRQPANDERGFVRGGFA